MKNKPLAADFKKKLKELETRANNPSFINYLKEKQHDPHPDIFALRKKYDLMQLQKVVEGIEHITTAIQEASKNPVNAADRKTLSEIQTVLKDIKKTASNHKSNYDIYVNYDHYYELAKKFATHYIPFNQSNDPFKGPDFAGYCWGHTHQYGKLVSKGLLDNLSEASNKQVYRDYKRNWTITDILFRRIGWYFRVSLEQQMRSAIWNALKDLDDKSTFNFNFLIGNGFHSTSLRMVGKGIEYYENNYGVVKFDTREAAVNFITGHLLHEAENSTLNFITVYKLPYSNDPKQDMFTDLTIAQVAKEQKSVESEETVGHSPELKSAIKALQSYTDTLERQNVKGKIKANELQHLVKELNALPANAVKQRVDGILATKEHSLMLNRGTGFHFFASGFKSHSTTESLLQEISRAAGTPSITLELK
ncbi:hypothetical protein [Legionella clemsonensis]|nr:hypothetical protein [Legionella clemsonensis]